MTITIPIIAADGAQSTVTLPAPTVTTPANGPLFPRLGGMFIGTPQDYAVAAVAANLAKLDLAILAMYTGWGGGAGAPTSTTTSAYNAIKKLNPNILLGNYTIFQSTANAAEQTYAASQKGPHGIGDWKGYTANGSRVSDSSMNVTLNTTPDVNGDRWPQWSAKWDWTNLLNNGPNWDIWFSDNNFYQPRVTADWDRSGTDRPDTDPTARSWWRAGQAAYYKQANTLKHPGQMLMVNADSDLTGGPWLTGTTEFTDYQNLIGGAFLEALIGESWSVDTWDGWAPMMAWYHGTFTNLLTPQAVMFDMHWATPNSDYQTARYGFAACLMDNGYFTISDMGQYSPNTFYWIDEFDLAGTKPKWLGTAIDPPQTAAWSRGVYMRRFAGGLALVNPKGNGPQTVTPPAGYTRLVGKQAPTINTGAAATTVTLADRDGLLLVKAS